MRACCVQRRLESRHASLQFSPCSQLVSSVNYQALWKGVSPSSSPSQVSLPSGYRTHEPRQLLLNYIPSPRVIFYPGKKPNRAFSGSACRLLVLAYESLGSSASTTEPPPNNNKDTKYPLKKITSSSRKPTSLFLTLTFHAQLDRPFQNLNSNGGENL